MKRTGPTPDTRQLVLDRAENLCERCGKAGEQIHHRLPRGAGGTSDPEINSPSNLIVLCSTCHAWIESNRSASYDLGLLVRRGQNPADVPVFLFGETVLLTPEGDYA